MNQKKNFLILILFSFAALIATLPLIFAFESSIINVTAKIESGIANHIVINEVYYDTGARQRGNKTEEEVEDEWIELYNPTDTAINLKNWSITDNSGIARIITANRRLNPGQFAVIAKDSNTFNFWNIPRGALKIRLREKLGNGLDNQGDRVILYDPLGNKVDAMSYGEDTEELNPSVPGVLEGHSLARSPKGFDTDRHTDWYELTEPNPGTNPHSDAPNEIEINFSEDETGEEYKEETKNNKEKSEEIITENVGEQNNAEIDNEIILPDENESETAENTEENIAATTTKDLIQEKNEDEITEDANENLDEQNNQNENKNNPGSSSLGGENQETSSSTPEITESFPPSNSNKTAAASDSQN